MKKRTAWVLVAGVAAVAVGAAAVGLLALMLRGRSGGSSSAGWSSHSYLYLDLGGEIPEQPPSEFGNFLERRPPSLRGLVQSLDRAASDPNISAVVLRTSFLPDSGWGKVQELRDAIGRFRKSGKPAYAHLEFAGNKEYYLASACSKVFAVPSAILDVSGLESETTFLRGTLDKLGVQAQFVGIGKYKNAPNQFTEDHFTEPHREQMNALLDSFFEQYVAGLSEGRGKTVDEIKALVDRGPYEGKDALAAGLVDELLYADQVEERLASAEKVTPSRYLKAGTGFSLESRPKLALVYAVGEISIGDSHSGGLSGGGVAGSDTIGRALRQARLDDAIKAVILRVDSPGGSGTASDVIWREVALLRKKKPVIVSFGDVAASGGYYIAMGADVIVSQPGTITGSIGVFGGKFSLRGLYDKIGLSKEILTRGKNAALFTEYRPWSDEERDKVHGMMATFYDDFIEKAADGRHTSKEKVHEIAQGRVWSGAEALRIGLVDQLGGMDVALEVAKKRAGIDPAKDVTLVVMPEHKGFLETILERQEDSGVESALPADLRTFTRLLRVMDGRPLARLPFELKIR